MEQWHRVDPVDVPGDGRVRSVVVDGRTVALARCGVSLGALDNRCPHQGGPLGEGSIENGWLRCPWHGYDYDPLTGQPPRGFSDGVAAYEVDERADAVYGMTLEHGPNRTVLTGDIRDQAQLFGLLGRLQEFGIDLLAVEPADVSEGGREPGAGPEASGLASIGVPAVRTRSSFNPSPCSQPL